MCAKKSSMQLVFSSLLLIKNVKKQKMKKRQNWKKRKMMEKALFSLKQQQIMQVHMRLFVDKIIHNVVIWITQEVPEFGGFYKNGEFCSGECEEIKLKYIRK